MGQYSRYAAAATCVALTAALVVVIATAMSRPRLCSRFPNYVAAKANFDRAVRATDAKDLETANAALKKGTAELGHDYNGHLMTFDDTGQALSLAFSYALDGDRPNEVLTRRDVLIARLGLFRDSRSCRD